MLGVYVTAQASEAPVVDTPETPIYLAAPPEAPRNTSHPRSRDDVHERQLWNKRESPIPPIDIPDNLPPIDLTREITNDDVFRATGSTPGTNSVDNGARTESVIPRWRFLPAEAGGGKVKQIVQMPVRFVAP
jgi:hypothetical protein